MKTAHYIGNHTEQTWTVRAFTALQKFGQKGPLGKITHVEAIHDEFSDGSVLIASSSLREGGVRSKRVSLDPGKWIIVDTPSWDVDQSKKLLETTKGLPYDWRGAAATLLAGHHKSGAWFCNEWVGDPFLVCSFTFGPPQFAAIALSLGQDVTESFFKERQNA